MTRAVAAIVRARLLALSRSPVGLVVIAAFALLAVALPPLTSASRAEGMRQFAAWVTSTASALLLLSGALVPLAGGGPAARAREARLAGARVSHIGHALAAALFLGGLAALLAGGCFGAFLLRFGPPDPASEGAALRAVAFRNDTAVSVGPGESWMSGAIDVASHGGTLVVELEPSVRYLPMEPGAERVDASAAAIEASWKAGGRSRSRRLRLFGARPMTAAFEVDRSDGRSRGELELRLVGRGVEVTCPPGAVTLLAAPRVLLPGLVRTLLVVACAAAALAAVTQWFAAFVRPLIAVAAALTLALGIGSMLAFAEPAAARVAAVLPADPVRSLRRGHDVSWREVLRAALLCTACVAATSAGALRPRWPAP